MTDPNDEAVQYALVVRQRGSRVPTVTSVAVDTLTGRCYYGSSGEKLARAPAVDAVLPMPPREPWPAANCAEVAVGSKAISDGADPQNLAVFTVLRRHKRRA